jgi:hypothetical protein
MSKVTLALSFGFITLAGGVGSFASPVVDGTFSPGEYGPATSVVTYDPTALEGNFGAPGPSSDAIGYSVYLEDTGGILYGLLQTNPVGGGTSVAAFANLYFDLDRQNGNGSDLGFEIGNKDVFIPGPAPVPIPAPEVTFAISSDGGTFEFSIPNSDFTGPIAGLNYNPGQVFPDAVNPTVTLRLSQSFGYSVAGGATFGNGRLGAFNVVDAPEPTSMALFGVGLAAVAAMRRRQRPRAV